MQTGIRKNTLRSAGARDHLEVGAINIVLLRSTVEKSRTYGLFVRKGGAEE
jgi:hypothetical protein